MLIGSKAAIVHFPNFWRKSNDVDLMIEKDYGKIPGIETVLCPPIFEWYGNAPSVIGKNELYTLKMSHIFWDHKWDKHFSDLLFMKKEGCELVDDLFLVLYNYWNEHNPSERSNLKQTAKDFFNNALNTDHDHLHELLNPNPAYKQILIGEVETSDELFFQLSDEEKARIIREEVQVMAYERKPNTRFDLAYTWMLKKFLMKHSPIRQAIWGIENYDLIRNPIFNFINYLNGKVNSRSNL